MEGVHLSLIPELGNKVRRAFIEGVHLERVHLERVDCIFSDMLSIKHISHGTCPHTGVSNVVDSSDQHVNHPNFI